MLALCATAACAGPGLDVDDVLVTTSSEVADTSSVLRPAAEFDAQAISARAAAESQIADVELQVAAALSLFRAAEVRVYAAAFAHLDASSDPTIDQVVNADDHVDDDVRAEVEALTQAGLRYAERALEQDPADLDALLARGMNTTLLAWSLGERRALLEGFGAKCGKSTIACLEADETHACGAPLRLRGRFLSRAPWPVGDRAQGLKLLQRSVEVAPVTLNWLFLGDALFEDGQASSARAAWQHAVDAESGDDSRALSDYHRASATRRLAALD